MNGRESIIEELIENIDSILDLIQNQELIESEFASAHEIADQLREEIVALR